MASPNPAQYADGRSARVHDVWVQVREGWLHWTSAQVQGAVPLTDLKWDQGVGQTPTVIHLPDGGFLSVPAPHGAALALLCAPPGFERGVAWIESRLWSVMGVLVLVVGLLYSGLRWGVPVAAEWGVAVLPESVDRVVGQQSLNVFDGLLNASAVLPERQAVLIEQVNLACQRTTCPEHQLLFRQGGPLGANAFALPGGAVVLTDELIELAQHDEEVVAVVAHELGHVQARHGMRMALQSIGAGVVLVSLTGELSNVSDMAAGLPSLLLERGYSRSMEVEADDYAARWLAESCIAPSRLADILGRLDSEPSETGWLDSHPGTAERMRRFRKASSC